MRVNDWQTLDNKRVADRGLGGRPLARVPGRQAKGIPGRHAMEQTHGTPSVFAVDDHETWLSVTAG